MVESADNEKPVFYIYNEGMMLHRDHNYHSEEGKLRQDLPPAREGDFASPEVPFRIKSIHDYLLANPANAPLLP